MSKTHDKSYGSLLPETIRLYGTADDSIVDGPGLRFAVFVQGCTHACPGCHNPESQPKEGGSLCRIADLYAQIEANPIIHGVTLSGGEPFEQCGACLALAQLLKPQGYGLWVYSGYLYEELIKGIPDPLAPDLLALCDVLVDGPYVQQLASRALVWRGSANQRIIDLKATRRIGSVQLWHEHTDFPKPPPSW